MKRVCHVTSVHTAKDGRIFYKECSSLAKVGYDVYEIAPNVKDELSNGVKIYGVMLPKKRAIRMFFGRINIYTKCLEINADVYHFHDPELIPVGLKLKKNNHKKVVFDSHEDVPFQILTKTWLPKFFRKIFSQLYAYYEKYALKDYDALISVTPHIVKRLRAINPNTYQITNYPIVKDNWIDKRSWNNSIAYFGFIDQTKMIDSVVQAVENVDGVSLLLGGLANNKYLEKLKACSGWKSVKYYGRLPFIDVQKIIYGVSVGIALNDYIPNYGGNIGSLGNTKQFEFMQMGIPIICTDFVLWKEIIGEWKCGICVNPHDISAIRDAINYLIENKDIAKEMGDNGRRAVMEKYNWNAQEAVLLTLYDRLFKD